MKTIFSLCLLLAPAAFAAEALPAFASFDPAQLSALRAGVAALKSSPIAAAQKPAPSLPSVPAEKWNAVLAKIRDKGEYKHSDDQGTPSYFALEDVRGPVDAAHTADYAAAFGEVSEDDGLFHAGWVDIVSENWTFDAKHNWRIEQRLFRVGIDGTVKSAMHNVLHETPDRHVLGEDELDPEVGAKASLDSLIARWSQYQPSGEVKP